MGEGLNSRAALASITIHAAQAVGIGNRVGSLETGKGADMALFKGDPLDMRSHTTRVFINEDEVTRVCYPWPPFDKAGRQWYNTSNWIRRRHAVRSPNAGPSRGHPRDFFWEPSAPS